jgi:hypothetical protein
MAAVHRAQSPSSIEPSIVMTSEDMKLMFAALTKLALLVAAIVEITMPIVKISRRIRSLLMNDHVYALPILGAILEWAPRHRPTYTDQLATHANSSSRRSTSVGLTRKRISD